MAGKVQPKKIKRNELIRQEWMLMNNQFIRTKRIYEVLADKYFLDTTTIRAICNETGEYKKKTSTVNSSNDDEYTFEITLKKKR